MESAKERKIISLERQILLLNLAKAGMYKAPKELQETDEFTAVLNNIERIKREAKRALSRNNNDKGLK